MNAAALLAGLLSGVIGSMGMGGGAVLLIYLTVFKDVQQLSAQGINLIFFIPIGIISIIIYSFKGQMKWQKTLPIAVFGVVGAFLGLWLVNFLESEFISKIFALFLIALGLREVFCKTPLKSDRKNGILKKE